jgi:hypothetical protein
MIIFEITVDEEVAQIALSINVVVEQTEKHISENNLNFTNVFSLMASLCKEIKISYLEVWNPNSFSDCTSLAHSKLKFTSALHQLSIQIS